jgi:hypothetical protein
LLRNPLPLPQHPQQPLRLLKRPPPLSPSVAQMPLLLLQLNKLQLLSPPKLPQPLKLLPLSRKLPLQNLSQNPLWL